MQDLWRVCDSDMSMQDDLDDLVEYHRFLSRFKEDEAARRKSDILYDGKRFGSLVSKDKKTHS